MRWTLGVMAGELGMYVMPVVGMFLGFLTMAFWKLWSGLAWASGLLPLALLGLFFGLCYVFVRVWEDEDHPDVPAKSLLSYMVVHPRFLERLEKEDKRFYQKHFEDNYADGLTFEQVEALRKWCKRKNVATVPLNHTMSFAHWIFLGYFITWLMGGNVLNRALALL
jgi:prepilin signal peptidase PulO-like enzyme (type II secretory pathway)